MKLGVEEEEDITELVEVVDLVMYTTIQYLLSTTIVSCNLDR